MNLTFFYGMNLTRVLKGAVGFTSVSVMLDRPSVCSPSFKSFKLMFTSRFTRSVISTSAD